MLPGDRVLLGLASVLLILISVYILSLALGLQAAQQATHLAAIAASTGRLQAVVLALGVLALSLRLLWVTTFQLAEEQSVLERTDLGEVRIALRAIESLAKRASRQIEGVKDVGVRVARSGEGVVVTVTLDVLPDSHIPSVADTVRQQVRQYLEKTVGLQLAGVQVSVRGVASLHKPRVE